VVVMVCSPFRFATCARIPWRLGDDSAEVGSLSLIGSVEHKPVDG